MSLTILDPARVWVCPSCKAEHLTREAVPFTPMHACPMLRGLTAPFVSKGAVARHVAVEREDMIGSAVGVQFDDAHRPVMAVRTERSDGSNDTLIFAATATSGG